MILRPQGRLKNAFCTVAFVSPIRKKALEGHLEQQGQHEVPQVSLSSCLTTSGPYAACVHLAPPPIAPSPTPAGHNAVEA
jgi:hypothetical protein